MSTANITLRITATPVKNQSQEEADAQLVEVFAHYPPESLADTLAADIWTNTDAGWLGLKVEILGADEAGVATS